MMKMTYVSLMFMTVLVNVMVMVGKVTVAVLQETILAMNVMTVQGRQMVIQ